MDGNFVSRQAIDVAAAKGVRVFAPVPESL
jgi:hypothetical protein